jgi:hypothetical protein
MKKLKKYQHCLISLLMLTSWTAQAGPLTPPAPPTDMGSAMYTIGDICNRLDTGAAGSKKTFTAPTSGPGSTGCTLNDVMNKAPAKDNANGAQPSEVGENKKYWGLTDSHWGMQTGTGTTSGSKRFTDNGNGTVTDNQTGLIWTKSANCAGARMEWAQAVDYANALANGTCGLSDGSKAGDWRLPNIRELRSLIDYSQYAPALPSEHPFLDVQSWYWSSTTYTNRTSSAWLVYLNFGGVSGYDQAGTSVVWAVRGGQ